MKNEKLKRISLEIESQVENLLDSDFAKYMENCGRVLREQQKLIYMLQNKLDNQASELKRQQMSEKVNIVRCKDCINRTFVDFKNQYHCRVYYGLRVASDMNYCCFGQRKKDQIDE